MRKLLLLALLVPVLSQAQSTESRETGFYLHGGIDRTDVGVFFLDNSTGFNIGGGWRFLPYLSVEGGYNDFGDFDLQEGFATIGPSDPSVSIDSLELGLASKFAFGESGFFGSARLGIHSWDSDLNDPSETDTRADGEDVYYGVGVGYDFNPTFGLSLNFDRYDLEEDEIDRFGVRGEVRF